ncbi:MAG: chromosomal replication initiator protein DnaA [Clostridia bacterium]|nr:chromosomal replication initiator protein DnaA [Clostridia bacterium]MBQ7224788.1 chromosomal replication initiator protein DnaA [Clostridia bacterium]
MNLAKETWQEMLPKIETEVTTIAFDLWIKTLEALDVEDDKLILLAPTETSRDTINRTLRPIITRILTSINPLLADITLLIPSEVEEIGGDLAEMIEKEEEKSEEPAPKLDAMLINPRYTFDNFVVGECNRFAVAAARAVAEDPGENYNPLFIYGGSGLGKTHIMHAIGNYIRKHNRHLKVLYVSSEKFLNELVASIRKNGGVDFREKYRSVDVLMIDDIQFITGKKQTQEELFHTFNDLYQAKKQIILASDRPPKEIPDIEDRLRTRFEWGLIADVQPPELETRIAILQKKAQMQKYNVPEEVLNFMAQRSESNIREMESLLNKVILLSKLYNKPVTVELASEAFKDYAKPSEEALTAEDIIEATLKLYPGVTKEELLGKKRDKEIVEPRMICTYLIAELLPLPLTSIGTIMGGRDHTTIIHAKSKVAGLIAKDDRIKAKVDDIRNMVYKN